MLATRNFFYRRVYTDPERIVRRKKFHQLFSPALFFDDVLHQQVVASGGECGYRAIKAAKEVFTPGGSSRGLQGAKTCVGELVGGVVAEAWIERAASARASVDLPALEVPLRRMILLRMESIRSIYMAGPEDGRNDSAGRILH